MDTDIIASGSICFSVRGGGRVPALTSSDTDGRSSGEPRVDDELKSDPSAEHHIEQNFQALSQNGFLRVEDVTAVLKCDSLVYDDVDIQAALEVYLAQRPVDVEQGDGDGSGGAGLTLPDVLEVYHRLGPRRVSARKRKLDAEIARRNAGFLGVCKKALATCHNWKKSFSTWIHNMQPTTRLIIVIIVISFFMAMVVAGTAIGLNWADAMKAQNEALRTELNLVLRAVEAFTVTQAMNDAVDTQQNTARMLANMIEEVGWQLNMQTTTVTQLGGARVAGLIVDNLLYFNTKNWMRLMAQNLGLLFEEMCTTMGASSIDVPQMVNRMNQKLNRDNMTAYHEIMIVAPTSSNGGTNGSARVLTDLKFANHCPNGTCGNISIERSAYGGSGSFFGLDYTMSEVYGGYSYLPCNGVGLVYKASNNYTALKNRFIKEGTDAINVLNIEYQGSTEIMIQLYEKPGWPLTTYKLSSACPKPCTWDHAGGAAILNMVNGSDPWATGWDYRETVDILSTVTHMRSMDAVLLFEIDVPEVKGNLLTPLAKSVTKINSALPGSLELMIGQKTTDANGSLTYNLLTAVKSPCPASGCLQDEAMYAAAVQCQAGVGTRRDYRDENVLVAYSCLPDLELGIVLEIDEHEIKQNSIDSAVRYANSQNRLQNGSLELMIGLLDSTTRRVNTLTDFKDTTACSGTASCLSKSASFGPMLSALSGSSGTVQSTDYRGTSVMTTFAYSPMLATGFVFKIDVSEVTQPLFISLVILLFTALGIVIFGDLTLGIAARRMLSSIERTWEESRKAVEEQKVNFENLVSALYPKFVTEKLLSGESQIFLELPEATVFFSDICNFTMLSNQLTAAELLQWIGYTFGIMDHTASHFAIYKIKTIGDAYLAVSGLPGLVAADEPDYHTLRMARFAATITQIFSGRYLHPDSGACLEMIASHSAVIRKAAKKGGGVRGKAGSIAGSSETSSAQGGLNKNSKCNMRFGIAVGPLTCGVLQGKCPVFDVWGKTVNLACRMESTGRANCIHCTEGAYLSILKNPDNPFTFDKAHTTFAKGFGNVPAYFVRSCRETPPKVLLNVLALEPYFGEFMYDLGGISTKTAFHSAPTRDMSQNDMSMLPLGVGGDPGSGRGGAPSSDAHQSVSARGNGSSYIPPPLPPPPPSVGAAAPHGHGLMRVTSLTEP